VFLDREGGSRAVTAKGKAKLAQVVAIQKIALKFIGRNGSLDRLNDGSEVMKYDDAGFSDDVLRARPVPVESCRKFNLGPLAHGLNGLDL
jgi:hypothetical protein